MAPKKEDMTPEVETQIVNDPEELLEVVLPKTREQIKDVFIRVNDRTWLVKRGEKVMLPRCAVEVLEHQEQAISEILAFEEQNVKG